MKLFPAIDMLDGKCVRLLYGDKNKVTVYGDIVDMAKKWQDMGAKYIHLVDLNGSFSGNSENLSTIKKLVKSINIPCQLGGGIRTFDDVKERLEDTGVSRVILGTTAYKDSETLEKCVSKYGEKIAVGIDVKDDYLVIKGWVEKVNIKGIDFALKMKQIGVKTIIYTDISRDGALTGVNAESTIKMQRETGLDVIASGGVKNMDDLYKLKEMGSYGAILGRSIYTGSIDLKEAIEKIEEV